jgi:hypothetical protein
MAVYGLKVQDPLAAPYGWISLDPLDLADRKPIGAPKLYKKFTKKCLIFNKKYDIIFIEKK